MLASIGQVERVQKKSAADERRGEFSSVAEHSMLTVEWSMPKVGCSMLTLEWSMMTVEGSILEPETSKDFGASHS